MSLEILTIDRTGQAEDIARNWLGKATSDVYIGRLELRHGRVKLAEYSHLTRSDFIRAVDSKGNSYGISERGKDYNTSSVPIGIEDRIYQHMFENLDFVLRQVHYLNKMADIWRKCPDASFTPEEMIVIIIRVRASFDRDEAVKIMERMGLS
jgi:hypothetical protein